MCSVGLAVSSNEWLSITSRQVLPVRIIMIIIIIYISKEPFLTRAHSALQSFTTFTIQSIQCMNSGIPSSMFLLHKTITEK